MGLPERRGLSRRSFLKAMGISAAGVGLSACAPRALEAGPHGAAPAQLVYQDWRTDWFPAMAQRMLEPFHADHPGIRVFYTPDPENLHEQMMADFDAGTAPDVVAGCCEFLPIWAQSGHLLNLRPFVEGDLDQATINDWDTAQYQSYFLKDGTQYALPKYHGALGLFYNKDLFDRFGVDYPDRTWDHGDYLIAMRKLTHDRGTDGRPDVWGSMLDISWDRIQMHVNGWGGHFVDPNDVRRSMMGRAEAIEAMDWIQNRMWDDGVMASFLDVQNLETRHAFIQERIAMVEDGSWALKDILEQAPFRVGVTTFPAGPARRVTLATTDAYAIYAGTRHPEAAWELVKYLTGREYGRAMADAHLLQPARASLVSEWTTMVRDSYPTKAEGLDLGAFADGHLQGYSVTAEVFANQEDARRIAQAAWEQIFTLGQQPVEIMRQISDEIQAVQPGSEAAAT